VAFTDWFNDTRYAAWWASLADPVTLLALASAALAGALVLVSTFVKTMIPLRWLAVGSNVGFIVYGLLQPAPLMVVLHAALLPINLWRLRQMIELTRRVARLGGGQQLELWLRPYMRSQRRKAGDVIFARGDSADRMYFLVDGEIELPEVGGRLGSGQMFGEIAFFAPDRRRTSSARCVTPCTLLSIDEDTFKQLVYQNPEFGFEVVQLIAGRLSEDVRRLQAQGGVGVNTA
jgi:CRP/FNR family transcriptional regulator, cyclic AMP receptor protein